MNEGEEKFVELIKMLVETLIDDLRDGCESKDAFVAKCNLLNSMLDYTLGMLNQGDSYEN